jgi:hypothetical protein
MKLSGIYRKKNLINFTFFNFFLDFFNFLSLNQFDKAGQVFWVLFPSLAGLFSILVVFLFKQIRRVSKTGFTS